MVPSPGPAGANVRVFLPTYRRPAMLVRAVESLRAQTVGDWVCELHNDDPDDHFPAALVERCGDPRIRLHVHECNLGCVETFNRFYRATPEPYYSILEDDNWWDPRFLETLLTALAGHPSITVAWCNQRVWHEETEGGWRDSGHCVHPDEPDAPPRLVFWGEPAQAVGAVHANGAMLVRSRPGEAFPTPAIAAAGIEPFRERLFPHPMLYVPAPMAHFSVTRQSARTGSLAEWSALQTALLASFVRHARLDPAGCAALWRHYHAQPPAPTTAFLVAGLQWKECRPFLRLARAPDWRRVLRGAVRHPRAAWNALQVTRRHADWWETLDRQTAERFAAMRAPTVARHQAANPAPDGP